MSYQSIPLDVTRRRKVFSIGLILTADTFEWSGKWFKYVEIEEQLCKERYSKFDDGWTYQEYWSKWKTVWRFHKIV